MADRSAGRLWRDQHPERTNRLGQPVAYALLPAGPARTAAADPTSSIASRAAFATRHLWVTRYDPAERYSAGDLLNQHPGGAGLPAYTAKDRDIDGADIVLWHTFGMTHFPRPEDWPVMPVDRVRIHAQAGRLLRPQPHPGRPRQHQRTLRLSPGLANAEKCREAGSRAATRPHHTPQRVTRRRARPCRYRHRWWAATNATLRPR